MTSGRTLLQEAEDPRTLPGRLEEIVGLSRGKEVAEVREVVAAHPNVPPDLLRRIATWHPEAVLRNPALPLVLLEDPGWAGDIERRAALRLSSFEDVPVLLLSALAAQPGQVGQAARLHVGLAGECGADWEDEAGEALWEAAALPGGGAHESPWGTVGLMDEKETFPARLVSLGLVAPWLLGVLTTHDDPAVRRAVAHSPHAPRDLLALLRRAGSTSDLGGPAPPDPALPASDLTWLARGGPWAKWLAARHPNTPPAVLEALGREHGEVLAGPLFRNPSAPAALRESLAVSHGPAFRRAWARHPETPPAALAELAGDADEEVRQSAARRDLRPRPSAPSPARADAPPPAHVLPAPSLRDKRDAMEGLEEAAGRSWAARTAKLANPDVPARHLVESLARDFWPCRLAVARNPAVLLLALEEPEAGDALARLARDGNRLVRAAARAALG